MIDKLASVFAVRDLRFGVDYQTLQILSSAVRRWGLHHAPCGVLEVKKTVDAAPPIQANDREDY